MTAGPPDQPGRRAQRAAYRRWLGQAHPDRGGDPDAFVVGMAEWERRLVAPTRSPELVFHRRPRTPLALWTAWRAARSRAPRVR